MRSAREICGAKDVRRLYKTIRDGMALAGFTNVTNEVRTIDGAREEGLWSFVNANDEYANAFARPGHAKLQQAPVGIFEVGGSSVQVAYVGGNNFTTAVNTRCSEGASTWPDIATNSNSQYDCPHGAYIATLMSDRKLGILRQRPAKFDRALTSSDVNNGTLSWIPGYLLLTYSK